MSGEMREEDHHHHHHQQQPHNQHHDVSDMVEQEEMPYWVRTVDQSMRHTSYPDHWNKNILEQSSLKHTDKKSNKSSTLGSKKGKKQKGTSKGHHHSNNLGILGIRGSHSDTASLTSRVTSSTERRKRKRSRRLGLCLALLLLALFLAAMFGWLIYYWLLIDDSRPEPLMDGRRMTNGDLSVRILNETYDPKMADPESPEFQNIAGPLCEAMDSAFQKDANYSDVYHQCQVFRIRHISDVPDCACKWTSQGSLLVEMRLSFNGTYDRDEIGSNMRDAIEDSTTKDYRGDLVYVFIKNFLVDIRPDWKRPYDALEASITIPVFNLNYSTALENSDSENFQAIARPFCNDIQRILTDPRTSIFYDRYISCSVSRFRNGRDRITFEIYLSGREWRSVQKMLISVLYDGARNEPWQGKPNKWIGPLVIMPYNVVFTVTPTNSSTITTPTLPTTTTPESTTPFEDITYVYVILPTYNLTLTSGLRDPSSYEFRLVTNRFCADLGRLYGLSSYRDDYYNCTVDSFRNDPTALLVRIGYGGGDWTARNGLVRMVIRGHAPGYYLDNKEVYLVGGIFLLFGEIYENGTELHRSLQVVNLTFTSDLYDSRSPVFQYHARFFCQDMSKFYVKSYLQDRYVDCGVTRFTDNPVRIHFYLVFYGTDTRGLPKSVVDVIKRHAPPYYYKLYLAYLVGDLLVLPEATGVLPSVSVTPTNITVFPTSTIVTSTITDVTPTISFTDSIIELPDGIALFLYYETYNLTFTYDLMNPNSYDFLRYRHSVCDDMWRWYMGSDSPFTSIYRACNITSFTSDPVGVTIMVVFEIKDQEGFRQNVRQFLEYKAPKVYVPRYALLDVGDLLLIRDKYRISVSPTEAPSHTLMPPSMTSETMETTIYTMTSSDIQPTSTTIEEVSSTIATTRPATCGIQYELRNCTTIVQSRPLSVNVVPLYYEFGPANVVTLSYEFGLADFTFYPELYYRSSAMFQYLQNGFCKEIEQYYRASAFGNTYYDCIIDGFTPSPSENYPEKIYFTLSFSTEWFYELQQRVLAVLYETPPREIRSGYITLHVRDLYLIVNTTSTKLPDSISSKMTLTPSTPLVASTTTSSKPVFPTPSLTRITPTRSSLPEISTTVTSITPTTTTATTTTPSTITPSPTPVPPTYFIRMSFETLNLTYQDWLNDKKSAQFLYTQELFCADIDEILNDYRQYFPSFMGCRIDRFGGDPLRVNFSLEFRDLEEKTRTQVKDLVVSMLIENAQRRTYNNIVALLVGNLLIRLDSISVEFSTIGTTTSNYDAIAYNFTFYLYPGNTSYLLLDKTSQFFKEEAYKFCRDVDNIFANVGLRTVRNRYHGCAVDSFGSKREVKFQIILRDTNVVRASSIFNILAYSGSQKNLDGVFYIRLGDLYVAVDVDPTYFLVRLESFTTHAYPFTTTTPPRVNVVITLTLEVLKPGWSAELQDRSSARYRLLADSFCSDLSTWISEWKKDFMDCGNVYFSQNPFRITAELTFRGLQTSTLENDLNTIILERADRVRINNLYAMSIGSMLIYDKSLVLSQRTISVNGSETSTTTPGSTTTISTISTATTPTTTMFVPCLGASNLAFVAHPSKCDRFYQCVNGQAYPITCRPGSVFQDSTCVETPTGFTCQRGQG